jgi:N,N-dimethylformamidase
MLLTGYTEWPSYDPGASVPLHLSGEGPIRIDLVRLRHGDTSAEGPGLVYDVVPGLALTAEAQPQPIRRGSCVTVDELLLGPTEHGWSFSVWMYVTKRPEQRSTILSCRTPAGTRRLDLDSAGVLRWLVEATISETTPGQRDDQDPVNLACRVWYLVAVVSQPQGDSVEIIVHRHGTGAHRRRRQLTGGAPLVDSGTSISFGAHLDGGSVADAFDGKLEAPTFWSRSLTGSEVRDLSADLAPTVDRLLAWDFSDRQDSLEVTELCRAANGRTVNLPARAVTGHRWEGLNDDWRTAPDEYAAIHFHHDDLADARWPVTTLLQLPDDLDNGVYAARVSDLADRTDFVPFVVRAARPTAPDCRLVVLLPTFTYLAYADEVIFDPHTPRIRSEGDDWAADQGLLSQYNWHSDGSGVIYASWLRPLLNLRPDYRYWLTGHPHGLGADLYLLDWLDHVGIAYQVITDHDLHQKGAELLSSYLVMVTGSHPEYWTRRNVDTLTSFLDDGGRLVYAGGNGFGGYVGVHTEMPEATEMRRLSPSVGIWDSEPGEARLASTGEVGGHGWHHKPRSREITGVDISAMGFSDAVGFHRTFDSHNPRVGFAFEGVDDHVVGDFGLHMGGAAGYEVDATDPAGGTPPHALVVASTDSFDGYAFTDSRGTRRADMTFFETPSGGAVFSFASITYSGSLSHRAYDNNVSLITKNVLRRFLDPAPFQWVDFMEEADGSIPPEPHAGS